MAVKADSLVVAREQGVHGQLLALVHKLKGAPVVEVELLLEKLEKVDKLSIAALATRWTLVVRFCGVVGAG